MQWKAIETAPKDGVGKRANIARMNKSKALELLGGTVTSAAKAIRITPQAVTQWPDELPPRIADRVYAAAIRIGKQSRKQPAKAA